MKSQKPRNYHWIVKDLLVGCASPTISELQYLKDEGVTKIVNLQQGISYDQWCYTKEDLASFEIELLHMPLVDYNGATKEQFDQFIDFVNMEPRGKTAVHCYAGMGRTGTLLAAYVGKKNKMSSTQVISHLRSIWPKYVQTIEQEESIKNYLGR